MVDLSKNLVPTLGQLHHMGMSEHKIFGSELMKFSARGTIVLLTVLALAMPGFAAEETTAKTEGDHYYEPLSQETGPNGLKLMLRKLETTGRLMQVDAHPDDEDGGMLTLEARGKGVSTLLMTLTRGEGGQNQLGSNLFDLLGVVRTLE